MRYPASEKLEIIRLVERSHLGSGRVSSSIAGEDDANDRPVLGGRIDRHRAKVERQPAGSVGLARDHTYHTLDAAVATARHERVMKPFVCHPPVFEIASRQGRIHLIRAGLQHRYRSSSKGKKRRRP